MWLKYATLQYYYNPNVHLPELNAIALYTPRVVEVVKERPHWNATDFFSAVHPNTPYLHQLPCSWGALFMPKRWREFYKYMGMRFTEDAKANPVQIPKSRTNGWQVSSWDIFYSFYQDKHSQSCHVSVIVSHQQGCWVGGYQDALSCRNSQFLVDFPTICGLKWLLLN